MTILRIGGFSIMKLDQVNLLFMDKGAFGETVHNKKHKRENSAEKTAEESSFSHIYCIRKNTGTHITYQVIFTLYAY